MAIVASDTTAGVVGNPDRDVIAATSMLATSAASISTRVTSVPGNGARRMSAAFCSTESFRRSQRPGPVLTAGSVPRMPNPACAQGRYTGGRLEGCLNSGVWDRRVPAVAQLRLLGPLREDVFPPQGRYGRMVRERVNGLRDPFK